MAIDQRKRQRKLERKAAKRRAVLKEKRIAAGTLTGLALGTQMEAAARAPIYQCLGSARLFETGIGYIVLSRRIGHGGIVASFFLLDVFCLGVKDAFLEFMPRKAFELRRLDLNRRDPLVERSPAYARKLVEAAATYAAALGISAHPDYELAKRIFGDVDASECHDSFVFGKDGKPCFIAGPHDTPAKCQRIVGILHERLGENGFHYSIPVDPDDLDEFEFLGEED